MAEIYQPYIRPFYPRTGYGGAQDYSGAFKTGEQLGGDIASLVGLPAQIQQQQAQNAAANALLNTVTPPRAALVDPGSKYDDNPDLFESETGVPIGGTAPATGGVAALNTALAMQKAQEALTGGSPQQQLQRARAAHLLQLATGGGGGGGQPTGSWQRYLANQPGGNQPVTTTTRGKTAAAGPQQPFQIGSTPATDMSQISGYVDGTYGKGTFGQVMQNLHSVDLTTQPGFATFNVGTDKTPKTITIPQDDYTTIGKQINQLRIRNGQAPLDLNAGTTPNPQNPPGTITNPYPTKNALDVSAVPPGGYYVDPNGQTRQRQAPTL